MPFKFSNQEYADIVFVYGFANGNSRAAKREYERRFPNRRTPSHETFASVFNNLRTNGSFPTITCSSERPVIQNVREQDNIIDMIQRSPQLSTRRLSNRLNISRSTVWRTLKENNFYPYHLQRVQNLHPGDSALRLQFCRWVLENRNKVNCILFTDESMFTRYGILNLKNSHRWSTENPKAVVESNFQIRFSINLWCGIIGDQLIGPFVFENRLTGLVYKDFLENQLPVLLEDVPLERRHQMIFHHDGAPAHYLQNVREHLQISFLGRWIGRGGPINWPPRSPDLNPLDYFLWGHLKQIVYAEPVNSKEELLNRILNACELLRNNRDGIGRATNSFINRARLCINYQGNHFEQHL